MSESAKTDPSIWDVVIVGAGVVGAAIARRLSRLDLNFAVVEKHWDVGEGASCRNSGVLHSGIYYAPNSLRSKLCMAGRELFEDWCHELGVPVRTPGKLVVAQDPRELPKLDVLERQGEANGVSGLRRLSGSEIEDLQPGIKAVAALHVPSAGIVTPYAATIAFAEDAAIHGVRFFLGRELQWATVEHGIFRLGTSQGEMRSRWLINAAGVHSDAVARNLDPDVPTVYPCRGEYLVLDKTAGERLKMLVYPVPPTREGGLGIHVSPTVEGNVLAGPSAEYGFEAEDHACTEFVGERLIREARAYWPGIVQEQVIGAYAGVRAKLSPPEVGGARDFHIRESKRARGLVNLIGLESPALTAAPAIAELVVDEMIGARERLEPKEEGVLPSYRWPPRFDDLPEDEKRRRVEQTADHGEIVCRCEGVTRYEVLRALKNPLGVKTLAGLKYRTRLTMGRCGGSYCLPRIVSILQEECGWNPEQFVLKDAQSPLFAGWVKG